MKVRGVIAAGLLAALVSIGCGGGDAGDESTYLPFQVSGLAADDIPKGMRPAATEDVAGRGYDMVAATGADMAPGVHPRLVFTRKTVEPSVDCNNVSFDYTLDEGQMETGRMISTASACAPERMAVESRLNRFLTGRVALSVQGERLLAAKGDEKLLLRKVPRYVEELEKWVWINDRTKLIFTAGAYSVLAPCRSGSGYANIEERTISFDTFGVLTPCVGEDASINDVLDALNGTVEYEMSGGPGEKKLTLGQGEDEVEFEGITTADLNAG